MVVTWKSVPIVLGCAPNSSVTGSTFTIFVTFDGVDERVFAPINAKDFADIVVNSIQQFPLNHKLFVESFLSWNKNEYKWKENTLIADFENSQKLEIDFEEKSELARIINIRLNS